jgi:propanediol dehydratase small subunit
MDEKMIESLVRQVLRSAESGSEPSPAAASSGKLGVQDYPLQEKRPELIKSRTGKSLDQLTLEGVRKGEVTFQDMQIDPATLEYQAQIAESAGRPQLAQNLRRAMELTRVPDDEILSLYNALRPYRSTKKDLLGYAERLQKEYNASACAQLFQEAAEIYEKRGMLSK